MDFEKICMMFTMQEPYYGILLSAMERIPKKEIKTLGVSRSGNVFRLYYNPDFINRFNIDTIISLLKHEVLHVAFHHFTIWDGEDENDTPEMHQLRNVAEDLEINGYLDRSKMEKEVGGVWAEDLGWDKYLGVREYLRRLLQKAEATPQKQDNSDPSTPENGGQGGNDENQQSQPNNSQNQESSSNQTNSQNQQSPSDKNKSQSQSTSSDPTSARQSNLLSQMPQRFDSHDDWPHCDSEEQAEQMSQIIDDFLVFAAEETEKSCGSVPGEMKILLDKIRQRKKVRPVADWKRYFRRYLGNEFSEWIRKSRKRESRRFPDAAGNRHRRKSHILVGIDTSGSVSMPEYMEFFGQIKTLSKDATFHVVECDSRIQYEYDYNGKPNQTLHGGGGTRFEPVIDKFLNERRRYDALVYFTDGGATIPANTPKDTLWVISSKGDHDRNRYKINGASVAIIEKPIQ